MKRTTAIGSLTQGMPTLKCLTGTGSFSSFFSLLLFLFFLFSFRCVFLAKKNSTCLFSVFPVTPLFILFYFRHTSSLSFPFHYSSFQPHCLECTGVILIISVCLRLYGMSSIWRRYYCYHKLRHPKQQSLLHPSVSIPRISLSYRSYLSYPGLSGITCVLRLSLRPL